MSYQGLQIIFGAAGFKSDNSDEQKDIEGVNKTLDALTAGGVKHLDSAQVYGMGASETGIGESHAVEKGFLVDSKWAVAMIKPPKGVAMVDFLVQTAEDSVKKMNAGKANIFYMHAPDVQTPFEETAKGINAAYQKGLFSKFGLSNYSPAQVREMIEVCKKHDYVLPSVYQGNYSAAARLAEDELIPLLRENKISFYAYSPIAGGFLAKDRAFMEAKQGRFDPNAPYGIYAKMFGKPAFYDFLDEWEKLAKEEGINKVELAYRWVNYHSALKPEFGDGIVFGASKVSQVTATIGYLKAGPLHDSTAEKINSLWASIKDDSILNTWEAMNS